MPRKDIWLAFGSTSKAWGANADSNRIYTNWRSKATDNTYAYLSSSDGKWVGADETEIHDVLCLFRF